MKTKIYLFSSVFIFILNINTTKAQSNYPFLDSLLSVTLDSMKTVMNVKSLSAAIQMPDTSIWADASGISALNVNVTPSDAYLVGSVTKTITSACILQLADQGVLNLDDSLYQWLDTIQYINPNITIRQLLRHQSGLYDVLNNPACQPALMANQSFSWNAFDLITNFIQPPISTPGSAWSYCNTNYFLLGMIIEAATGNPYYAEIRNRFYNQYGYSTIGIPSFESYTNPVAHLWLDLNGDGVLDDAHNFYYNYLSLNSAAGAAGGYYSTPTDITRWMRTYMRGDVLSPAMMLEAKTLVNASGSQGGKYGLGLMRNTFLGIEAFGHGGDLAYAASSWYFPTRDISISVLMNHNGMTSWSLLPVVSALLKTYNNYLTVSAVNENINDIGSMKAYPIPFKNGINLSINTNKTFDNVRLILSNAMGQELVQLQSLKLESGNNTISMNDLNELSSGVYFVSVFEGENKLITIKVIK